MILDSGMAGNVVTRVLIRGSRGISVREKDMIAEAESERDGKMLFC